ncbi:hypothetical protein JD490_09835 [Aeromonas dhakensis]|uniref:hypothetical protein n=1 Tax=Aeromonas dhakensis TaxID=196024 RepID=UPI00191FB252|nr:hypothetical protein [Aeromonas dhakensis]MBL0525209.1 hypothetical protein [Aeromonas dhakensis]
MIQEIVMRERGVELRKEVLIPDSITAPYEMKPPMWFKPSLPNQEPHPYVEYGVSWKDGQPVAWVSLFPYDHRFETDVVIEVNGTELWRRKYFFK